MAYLYESKTILKNAIPLGRFANKPDLNLADYNPSSLLSRRSQRRARREVRGF